MFSETPCIPTLPASCVFISQLKRYAQACFSFDCVILSTRRLPRRLLKKGYLVELLNSSFTKCCGRYGDLIQQYEFSLTWMLHDILTLDQLQWLPNLSDCPPISWPWYRNLTFTELWVVYMEHLQRVWHASRERLPFRTSGSLPLFRTCLCSNRWDQIPPTSPRLYSAFHLE